MSTAITQPHAMPLSPELIASLSRAVRRDTDDARPAQVVFRGEHSNDVVELHFSDGRTLMVKRGRYQWAAARFESSRLASVLLLRRAGVIAPAPLELPAAVGPQPLEAYWRVDLPTLQELWPSLADHQRPRVLHSWGELIRRVHEVRLPGHGALARSMHEASSFEEFIRADLGERLLPAIAGEWLEALPIIEQLRAAVPRVAERLLDRNGTLLHNDLHMGNVLCEVLGDEVRCVGLIDLEAALSGPPEADLAIVEVHHGSLFAQPLPGNWFASVRVGYGRALEPTLLTFFRAYHLLNMGFYSALVGHAEHAHGVAAAAREEVARLGV